jgi:hypothetical protein
MWQRDTGSDRCGHIMNAFHVPSVDLNDTDDSPRSLGVVPRRAHDKRGQGNVVINPTVVINAARRELIAPRQPDAMEPALQGGRELQCLVPLQAAKLRLLLEEPLTKPLGSMQSLHPVLRVCQLTSLHSWREDELTTTEPRIVLRRQAIQNSESSSAVDAAEADGPDAGSIEHARSAPTSNMHGEKERSKSAPRAFYGGAQTRPGRARSPERVSEQLERTGFAAAGGVDPAWASADTSQAQRDARMQLRAEWARFVWCRGAGRPGPVAGERQRRARDYARSADERTAAPPATLSSRKLSGALDLRSARRVQAMQQGCAQQLRQHLARPAYNHPSSRPTRGDNRSTLSLGNISPYALCASVVALAAFTFVSTFALTSALLAHFDASMPWSEAASRTPSPVRDRMACTGVV